MIQGFSVEAGFLRQLRRAAVGPGHIAKRQEEQPGIGIFKAGIEVV